MLDAVEHTARSAARALRRVRAVDGGFWGLGVALLGATLGAVILEARGGLDPSEARALLSWLLAAPLGALLAALRPLDLTTAAAEVDRRAGLQDRLGTALEFAGDPAPLAILQRQDAAAHAGGLVLKGLFPTPWRAHARRLLPLLLLVLLIIGGALLGDLPGRAPPAPTEPTDDVLASIDRAVEAFEERGDKAAVRLLKDLDRTLRRIRAQEADLRRAVRERVPRDAPEAEDSEPLPVLPPPPPRGPRLTADDLARLEEQTVGQLAMTETQQAEIVSDLFAHSRAASELMQQFEHDVMHEAEVTLESERSAVRDEASGADASRGVFENADLVANPLLSQRANSGLTENIAEEREDMIRRDLGDESQAAHDKAHDVQESFNQFLKDFVKDVQDIVAEAAVGKKSPQHAPGQVQVRSEQGVADRRQEMAKSGFEEVGDTPRTPGKVPPEPPTGGGSAGSPQGAQAAQGPPPDGAQLSQGSGSPGGPRSKSGGEGGETSAGAEGAGHGEGAQGGSGLVGGLRAQEPGRLERALGRLAEGRLPPETRQALFDRLARHKVQAGLASEADDVLVDYFAEAQQELVDNADRLPPLFRSYAQSYFDAIRPHATPTP